MRPPRVAEHTRLLYLRNGELRLIAGTATHQHYKGGLYRLLGPIRDADTGEFTGKVAYEHLYPYAQEIWQRDTSEFFGEAPVGGPRFASLTGEEPCWRL